MIQILMCSFPPAKKQCARGFFRLDKGYGAGPAGRAFAQRSSNIGVWILRFRIAMQDSLKHSAETGETS
jgi:hypothetical protein